jgi:hypothetical protein
LDELVLMACKITSLETSSIRAKKNASDALSKKISQKKKFICKKLCNFVAK